MESTNGRIEATDKFVLQIENWLRQVAENNNQSMNQTLLLDQSLIELSNEVLGVHKILGIFLYNYFAWLVITHRARKFKKVQAKKLVKSNKPKIIFS